METEQITIHVGTKAAKAYNSIPTENKRKLEAILTLKIIEATKTTESLQAVVDEIREKGRARGLTSDIMKSIIDI
ncbi:hypothetical protein MUP95_07860 [bacterium]|nr:hypothetical protein [bacterium]